MPGLIGMFGSGGGINPQTGMPYGTMSDEVIPQGARFPGDPGSGGIGGGPGPVPGASRGVWDEKPGPIYGPSGEQLGGAPLQSFIKFLGGL